MACDKTNQRLIGIAKTILEKGLATKTELCEAIGVKPNMIDWVLVSAEKAGLLLYSEKSKTGALNAKEWLHEQGPTD